MQTLLFRYPNKKLIPVWKLSTNITRLFGVTTLSSLILLYLNQMYIFRSRKIITITINLVFLLVTLSKINTLCLSDETKSGEKQR